jgi:DNA-binding transcriptional LysR family regulator
MPRTGLSLKWLEIFEMTARTGSVRGAAENLGLSVSTVSQHLLNLEQALGADLLDHARRPMVLTPQGAVFLRDIEQALHLIRRAEAGLASGNLSQTRNLRLGLVEDFDSEVAPELARLLAQAMPKCAFTHLTKPSHEILAMLRDKKLDAGVATRPVSDLPGVREIPLLHDPFVLATPAALALPPEAYLANTAGIPFLRYSATQIMSAQIEAQIRRLRADLPNRFEIESNQSIFGMVADGRGWTITTPASYARARRFQARVVLHRFPAKQFSRTLSLFTSQEYAAPVTGMIAALLRRLIGQRLIEPVTAQMPWLADQFYLMPDANSP